MKATTAKARTCTVAHGHNHQRKAKAKGKAAGEAGVKLLFFDIDSDEVLFTLDLEADMYARIKRAAGEADSAVVEFIHAAIQWKLAHLEKEMVPAGGKGGAR